MNRMSVFGVRLAITLLLLVGSLSCTSSPTGRARHVGQFLTESVRTDHFVIKARPGSRSAALLPEIAVRAEQDLQRMTTLFQVANDASYTLFIFDSFDDLRAVTGARPPVAGFVNGPYAYFVAGDPALAHEMAHLVAREAIGPGASPFLSEAIAETVFEPTKMASFDVEMKYLLSENRLPSLAELSATSDLMAWSRDHPEVGLYHVGGSWLQFLFRTRGAEKVKRYYVLGDTVAAFGEPLATLEASWRRWLEELPIRPEAMAAMAAKFAGGEPTTAIANETYIFRAELPDSLKGQEVVLRWKKDGMPYPGTGGLALVLVPAAVSDSGTYQLLLERPDGTIVGGLTVQLRVVDPVIFLPATN